MWLSLSYTNRNVRLILRRAPDFGLETLAQGLEAGGPAGRREREEAWLHPSSGRLSSRLYDQGVGENVQRADSVS